MNGIPVSDYVKTQLRLALDRIVERREQRGLAVSFGILGAASGRVGGRSKPTVSPDSVAILVTWPGSPVFDLILKMSVEGHADPTCQQTQTSLSDGHNVFETDDNDTTPDAN